MRLFWKIFLAFWLSHLMAIGVTVAILSAADASRDEHDGRLNAPPFPSAKVAQQARELAQMAPDRAKIAARLDEIEHQKQLQGAFFDARGVELSGREWPRDSQVLFERAIRSEELEFSSSREGATGARRVLGRDGQFYVFVARLPRPALPGGPGGARGVPHDGPQGGPGLWGLTRRTTVELARWLGVWVAAGVVALGLARYLAAPTEKLRGATRQLAAGHLSTRVAAKMGRRRDELADLGRDFDVMAERLERLLGAQTRLLGDISHELRSPLARLNVALDLVEDATETEKTALLARIRRESERLNELIGQLLSLSRLENAGRRLEKVDLSAILAEVAADADFEAKSNQKSIHISENAPCEIPGDAALLRSALENVARNAVLYTAPQTRVEISLNCSETEALIRVRDFGPGVPESALTEIFRPFYRVAEARDRKSGGTGLGLAITQRAVMLHGGSVGAKNAQSGGLEIEIRLPKN